MQFEIAPTGRLVRGTIHDCNEKAFLRAIHAYDKSLYIKWNPTKRDGYGCWELWRKPTKKTLVNHGEFEGCHFFTLEYQSKSLVHHIKDLEYLSYDLVDWLKQADGWNHKSVGKLLDDAYVNHLDKIDAKKWEEIRLYLKDHKSEMKDLYEYVRSGGNLAALFTK